MSHGNQGGTLWKHQRDCLLIRQENLETEEKEKRKQSSHFESRACFVSQKRRLKFAAAFQFLQF